MDTTIQFKDGDIFRWRWNEDGRSMHCKSGIAVAKGGHLHDTFWEGFHSRDWIDLNQVTIEFQGNPADMKEIPVWEAVFYRYQDVVNMNHSNNSRAPVYVKAGTSRCPVVMREYYEHKKAEAESYARSLQERVAECDVLLARIAAGDLDGHFRTMLSLRY